MATDLANEEKNPKQSVVQRPPSRKPCRFFHMNDCYRGDKCHMAHIAKADLHPCQTHTLWLEDPWNRPSCPWGEGCSRPHPEWGGPKDPELRRTNIALQTESAQLLRVKEYASKVVGAEGRARLTGTARSGTSRYKQKLVLLEARDPERFSRQCITDPCFCRSLLRVYLLGGGVCTSLEDVGKQVSALVSSGNFPGSSRVGSGIRCQDRAGVDVGTDGDDPLPVRVQALPKVMERQLIDEDSSFWEDNFPGLVRERQTGVFTHILSVVFVRGAFLYGISEASTHGRCILDNNNEDSPISRAFYKIKEVSSRANISYSTQWNVIDVGSSPGGWTSFLAARCGRVLSVDPAELDPAVLALPNVVHVKAPIQRVYAVLRALLSSQASDCRDGHGAVGESDSGGGGSKASSGTNGILGGVAESPAVLAAPAGEDVTCVLQPSMGPECIMGDGGEVGENGFRTRSKPGYVADQVAARQPGGPAGGRSNGTVLSNSGSHALVAGMGASEARAEAVDADGGADMLVSDMNVAPRTVADVLLAAVGGKLVKPGGLVVATFKDFCGREKFMRDEVEKALARLTAGTGGYDRQVRDEASEALDQDGDAGTVVEDGFGLEGAAAEVDDSAEGSTADGGPDGESGGSTDDEVSVVDHDAITFVSSGVEAVENGHVSGGAPDALSDEARYRWSLQGIETFKLLAGGRSEVTLVGRVAREDVRDR